MAGWSTTDKASGLTVSGTNNVTVTRDASAAANKSIRSAASFSSGKYYIEVTSGANIGTDGEGIGVANASMSLTQFLGGDVNGIGLFPEASSVGRIYYNAGTLANDAGLNYQTNGAVTSVAVDFTNELIWFRLNGGNWNGSGTANPATGTGGHSFSASSGPYYFALTLFDASCAFTANFGASAFAYTVPSGFAGPEAASATALTATNLAAGAASLGSPALAMVTGTALTATGITAGAATLGTPALTQPGTWTPVSAPAGTWTLAASVAGSWTPVTPPTTTWS